MRYVKGEPASWDVHIWSDHRRSMLRRWHKMWQVVSWRIGVTLTSRKRAKDGKTSKCRVEEENGFLHSLPRHVHRDLQLPRPCRDSRLASGHMALHRAGMSMPAVPAVAGMRGATRPKGKSRLGGIGRSTFHDPPRASDSLCLRVSVVPKCKA
jgi:hypothetical protein